MRIRDFHAENLLHLSQFDLNLGDDAAGLHIIYGLNEAGKSTLLSLLVDFLFGGSIADSAIQRYSSKSLLSGTLEVPRPGDESTAQLAATVSRGAASAASFTDDWTVIPVIRGKKGRKLDLLNGANRSRRSPADAATGDLWNTADITEELLQELVGGLTRQRYLLLFGFNHDRLRQGGESLLSAGGHAGISLFEAGGGVQFLRNVAEDLGKQSQALLDPTFRANSKSNLNKAWREYRALLEDSRKSRLHGEEWHRAKTALERMDERLASLRQEQQTLTMRQSGLERMKRVRESLNQWRSLKRRLLAMENIADMPRELLEEIPEILRHHEMATQELHNVQQECNALQVSLQELPEDDAILHVADEVESLQQRLRQYQDAVTALPGDRQSVSLEKERGLQLLKGLDATASSHQVEKFRIVIADEKTIRLLVDDWADSAREAAQAAGVTRDLTDELKAVQQAVRDLGDPRDTAQLNAVLSELGQIGDLDKTIRTGQSQIELLRQGLQQLLSGQTLFQGTPEALAQHPVPLPKTIDSYGRKFAETEGHISDLTREIAKTQKHLDEVRRRLNALELGGPVPIAADLASSRRFRDDGWSLVKRAWLGGESQSQQFRQEATAYGEDKPLDEAFERAVQHADEVADRMRSDSERSALRSQLLAEQEEKTLELEKLRQRLETAQSQYGELLRVWQGEWADSAVVTKSPAEMQQWVDSCYNPVIREMQTVASQELALAELQESRRHYVSKLASLLGFSVNTAANDSSPQSTSLAQLRLMAEAVREEETKRHQRQETLKERVREISKKIQQQREKQQELAEELAAVEERLGAFNGMYPFLPREPRSIPAVLDKIHELFEWVKDLSRLQTAVRQKEQVCNQFEEAVANLARKLEVQVDEEETWDHVVRCFVKRVHAAQTWQVQREERKQELQRQNERREKLSIQVQGEQSRLDTFLKTYGCQDLRALQELVLRAKDKYDTGRQLAETESHLLHAGDGLPLEDLVRESDNGPSVDELPLQLADVKSRLEQLAADISDNSVEQGRLSEQFKALNQSASHAADKLQEAEFQLSQVDAYWNQYLRLELANRLLTAAVEKFRNENETGVIAQASRIFRRLTLEHYVELVVEYDGDEPVIEAITADSGRRRVREMSDGTRDQLYLALRLAFVRQHIAAGNAVPLVMDDILVHFDDQRTAATLEVLQELAGSTQILYFTHHKAIVSAARRLQRDHAGPIHIHELNEAVSG